MTVRDAGSKTCIVILLGSIDALVHVPTNAVGWRYELVPMSSLVRV